MTTDFRELTPIEERGLHIAAAVARKQLEYAREILGATINEPVLLGAVLHAIAVSYAAGVPRMEA